MVKNLEIILNNLSIAILISSELRILSLYILPSRIKNVPTNNTIYSQPKLGISPSLHSVTKLLLFQPEDISFQYMSKGVVPPFICLVVGSSAAPVVGGIVDEPFRSGSSMKYLVVQYAMKASTLITRRL